MANREYEVWFLAQLRRLRTRLVLPEDMRIDLPQELESISAPKAAFERHLGRCYQETVDQQDITKHLDFRETTLARSASYRKLDRELHRLTVAMREHGQENDS